MSKIIELAKAVEDEIESLRARCDYLQNKVDAERSRRHKMADLVNEILVLMDED
jgi:hypothetical protein